MHSPWTSLSFWHGRPLFKRTTPWTSVRFGHGCAVLERTRPWTPFFSGMESLFSIAPDHVRHQVLGMDALVSIALDHDVISFGHGCFVFKRIKLWMPLGFGHGCCVLKRFSPCTSLGFWKLKSRKHSRRKCLQMLEKTGFQKTAAGRHKHHHVCHTGKYRKQVNTVNTSRSGASCEGSWDVSSSCKNHPTYAWLS